MSSLSKYEKVSPIRGVVTDGSVASDELHVTDLTFPKVFEYAVVPCAIGIAMSFAFFPGDDHYGVTSIGRGYDAPLLLSLETTVDVLPAVIGSAFFKSP